MADTDTLDGATVTLPKPGKPVSSARPPVGDDRLSNALGLGDTKRVLATDRAKIDAMEPSVPKLTPPPPAPTPTDPLQAFGQPAMWIATFGSLLTRHSLTTAIQAGAGVMQAVHQQDMEAAKHAYDTWKLQTENATKMAKFEQDAYKAAISKYAADARAGEAEVKTLAAAFKNAALTQVYETEGMAGVKKYVLAHGKQTEQLGETSKGIEEHHAIQTTIAEGLGSDDPAKQAAALDAYADQIGKAQQGKGSSATSRMGSLTVGVRLRSIAEKLRSGDPAQIAEAQKEASGMAEIGPGVLKPPKGPGNPETAALGSVVQQAISDKEAELGRKVTDAEAGQIYLATKAQHQAEAAGLKTGATGNAKAETDAAHAISDDAADLAADRVLAGDERATTGMARSAANITKVTDAIVRRAKERGMSGADIATKVAEFQGTTAGERTLGTRTANMEIAANEVKNMAPLALVASKKVDRTEYPTLNKIIIASEQGTGDENVVRFGLAANSLIYTYAKFLNPTGIPTDADKAKATDILSTAWTQGQFSAAVDQIKKEIASGQGAIKATRDEFREGMTAGGKPPASGDTQIVGDKATYDALPPGAHYRKAGDPEGSYRTKQ